MENNECFIDIRAIHYMEPVSNFVVLTTNAGTELKFEKFADAGMVMMGFHKDVPTHLGILNAQFIGVERATVPGFPFIIKVTPLSGVKFEFRGILHQKSANNWKEIPIVFARPT
jgi:hypothetical protein